MSEQEKERDARFSVLVPEPDSSRNSAEGEDQESEARKIMEEWVRRNSEEDGKQRESEQQEEPSQESRESEEMKVVVTVIAAEEPQNGELNATEVDPEDASISEVFLDPKDIPLPATPLLAPQADSEDVVEPSSPSSKAQGKLPAIELEEEVQMEINHVEPCADAEGETQVVDVPTTISPNVDEEEALDGLTTSLPTSPPPDFDDPRSPRSLTIPTLSVSPPPPPAPLSIPQTFTSEAATSGPNIVERGRSLSTTTGTTVPALSPTRSASSCTTSDETPNTPISPRARKTSSASGRGESEERGRVGLGLAIGEVKTVLGPDVVESPVSDSEGGVKFAFGEPLVAKVLHAVVEEEDAEEDEAEDCIGELGEKENLQQREERRKSVFGRKASSVRTHFCSRTRTNTNLPSYFFSIAETTPIIPPQHRPLLRKSPPLRYRHDLEQVRAALTDDVARRRHLCREFFAENEVSYEVCASCVPGDIRTCQCGEVAVANSGELWQTGVGADDV